MKEFIGLDIGKGSCQVCVIDETGKVTREMKVPTRRAELKALLESLPRTHVCLEVGGETPWVSRLLDELGHHVVACNARKLRMIAESTLKCDRLDAEVLARMARLAVFDPALVPSIYRRTEATQLVRAMLRARATLVRNRTACTNAARGLTRALGHPLPVGHPDRLPSLVRKAELPKNVATLVKPLLVTIEHLTKQVEAMDERIVELGATDSVVMRLQTIDGVGAQTALAYVCCIEDPKRFKHSRDVGAYLGLRPRLRQSGDQRHEGRITREGDAQLRSLLVQAAHALMRTKRSSELKTWARRLKKRVGTQKAAVALARKLAVVMHRLWVTGESFQPKIHVQEANAA